jgi:hypothetical protein
MVMVLYWRCIPRRVAQETSLPQARSQRGLPKPLEYPEIKRSHRTVSTWAAAIPRLVHFVIETIWALLLL